MANPRKTTKTFKMHTEDLHPDDTTNRLILRDWFIAEQKAQGLSDGQLGARVGYGDGWVRGFRKGTHWTMVSLQKLVRALGYELRTTPEIAGMTLAPSALNWHMSVMLASSSAERREQALRFDLGAVGAQLRELMLLSQATVARALKTEIRIVRQFEEGDVDGFLLVRAQRYFRTIGCPLTFSIHKPDQAPEHAAVEMKHPKPALNATTGGKPIVNVVETADRTLVWHADDPQRVINFPTAAWLEWLAARTETAADA